MSGLKRKREKTAEIQKNLEIVYKDGFRRAIIKSDENGRFIGIYYITPSGEYLKNMTDVINWLDSKSNETNLFRSNFNFISKKLSDLNVEEFVIEQNQLPLEISDYILEKKKSIAPGITTIENESISISLSSIKSENVVKEKKLRLTENNDEKDEVAISHSIESKETAIICEGYEKKEMSFDNVVFKPVKPFQYPLVPIGQHHVFERTTDCHFERMSEALKENQTENQTEYLNKLQKVCNNFCAFDNEGIPRVVFECDICLILWHTDCIGYRWLAIESLKFIICDNCFLLHKVLNVEIPNIFCDVDKLLHQESNLDNPTNPVKRVPSRLEPMIKLCKIQWLLNKSNDPEPFTKTKLIDQTSKKDTDKPWKYVFEMKLRPENVTRAMSDKSIHFKYQIKNIDHMAKIFADHKCQLQVDDKPVPIVASKITLKKGELCIPCNISLTKPSCKAIFYTTECNQDLNSMYINRCEELKAAMISSFYNKSESFIPPMENNKPRNLIKDNPSRSISVINPSNCLKVLSTSRVYLPKSKSISSKGIITSAFTQISNATTLVKLRQRKQDLGILTMQIRKPNFMKYEQFPFLNLPFLILEQILSSSFLSTQDKLNCRVANRVFKCIIDGGQVWKKLVINPSCVTGLENMLTFFRSKFVRKITFLIDFQESFDMEFLLSFISRLKMFPEYLILEKFTIKFTGTMTTLQQSSQLSIQDIFSCCKSLKRLSISSENPTLLAVSKKKLTNNSIEKIKLRNIQNIGSIVQTFGDGTPNCKILYCGDWSFVKNMENFSLGNITNLIMLFNQSVCFEDVTPFATLINLEKLTITKPIIDNILMNFLIIITKSKKLTYLSLETIVPTKNSYVLCHQLSSCFPKHITQIFWSIKWEASNTSDHCTIKNLIHQMMEGLPKNVRFSVTH